MTKRFSWLIVLLLGAASISGCDQQECSEQTPEEVTTPPILESSEPTPEEVVAPPTVEIEAAGWLTDFEQAKKEATARNQPILIDFSGSDWCVWCIRLDEEVFSQPEFKAYAADNLVLFLADFPNKKPQSEAVQQQNQALAQRFGLRGYPTVLLVSADGEVIGRTGYQSGGAAAYVEHLKSLLK